MAQNLPLELIEHVTDECLPDIEALRSSSLISKLWTIPAQKRLFSCVSIFPELVRAVPSIPPNSEDYSGYPSPQYILDGSIDKFKEHLEDAPHLADFVQELHLGMPKMPPLELFYAREKKVPDGAFTGANEIISRFRNMGSVSLSFAEDYDWAKLAFMHQSLCHALSSSMLCYLKIGPVTFATQSQFNNLLDSCVSLEVLIINNVKIKEATENETGQKTVEKLRPSLKELTVHTDLPSLIQIIEAFVSPSSSVDVSCLLRLSLWCKYSNAQRHHPMGPVCSLLRKARCLQHLQLFACLTGPLYQYVNPASLQTFYVCDQLGQPSTTLTWLVKSFEAESDSESGLALTELSIDICQSNAYSSENLSADSTAWAHLGATIEQHARQFRSVTVRGKGYRPFYMMDRSIEGVLQSEDLRDALGMRMREDVVVRFVQYLTQDDVLYSGSHCEDFYEREWEPTLDDWLSDWEVKDDTEKED
ncbi:uncharacterized protein EV420DRAFT_1552332 [Desarmillaria tabescens]|uniref:Uncharacterized protein n=1 Tax=Armillaria tabescens TaxID=1929756 RepID=A0AA39N307_ARMTA|nr:uncharacterized protein EV420DRAFT_1552332 [Desarmillaria tabescens]KAK0455628.1 hypothetical protein EV420DRAFT_1552332 [Desarmillaria tabescens]